MNKRDDSTMFMKRLRTVLLLFSLFLQCYAFVRRPLLLTNTRTLDQQRVNKSMTRAPKKMTIFTKMSSNNKTEPDTKSTTTTTTSTTNNNNETKIKPETWNPFRLAVLRLGLTEPAMTSSFNYGKYNGQFNCAYCNHPLFDSNAKYNSGSGWPSFWRSYQENSIEYRREIDGRLEVRCNKCSSHLGHVFLDGPRPSEVETTLLKESPSSDPRGKTSNYLPRFCINGASLRYNPRDQATTT
jgi:peptide-methionine (R)-S-oxide reductase